MTYLGTWQIDDVLTFTVTTHTFATGALTDADSVPSYRVYEDETGTAILNGSMAKLDDTNTTGHYSEQITLSAANGFEVGKTYSVYITATVASVTGGTVRSFQVESALATAAALQTVDDLVDDLESRLTSTRAGYLDNLSGGAVATAAALTTVAGYVDTEVAAVLAAVDTEVAAIKAKTDNLPTDPADQSAVEAAITAAVAPLALEATAQSILTDTAEIGVAGAGLTAAGLSAAGVRTAVGMASANLDTQLADLPTNAELSAAIAAGDDPVLAAIAALNNLSSAGAQAAAAAALTAYGAATGANVTSATSGLATAAALDAVDNYIDTEVAAIKAVTDQLATAMELDGAVYRFTDNALEQAPAGGGGGSDPLENAVPGAYAVGTAGWVIGTRLDAAVSSIPETGAVWSVASTADDIQATRGDTMTVTLTGLGNISARTKLWFTAKRDASDGDTEAMIQIVEGTGLTVVNGATGTAGNGSITVTDATTGNLTVALTAAETAKMPGDLALSFDVQMKTASAVTTLALGTITFVSDVTKATA